MPGNMGITYKYIGIESTVRTGLLSSTNEMCLGHNSAPKGHAGLGTTWTNKFSHESWPKGRIDCSLACYNHTRTTTVAEQYKKHDILILLLTGVSV